MAFLPVTQLETHPSGTPNPNPVINGNWETLEAVFAALASFQPGDSVEWDSSERQFSLRTPQQTLADGPNIEFDLAQGHLATVTIAGDRQLNNPTNGRAGTFYLRVIQDSTGGRSLTFDTDYRTLGGAGVTLSSSADAEDILRIQNFGDGVYYVVPVGEDFQ